MRKFDLVAQSNALHPELFNALQNVAFELVLTYNPHGNQHNDAQYKQNITVWENYNKLVRSINKADKMLTSK